MVVRPIPRFGTLMILRTARIVLSVVHRLQVREKILDLPSRIEVDPSPRSYMDVMAIALLLKETGLGIGAVKDGIVVVGRSLPHFSPDILGDELRLVIGGVKLSQMNLIPFSVVCPQRLLLAPFVVADHGRSPRQDISGGPVILLQLDDAGVREFMFKVPGYCGYWLRGIDGR